jgi:hypothetical protein
VRSGRELFSRSEVLPPLDLKPGVCVHCGGLGAVPEMIDEELPDAMVPCDWCRVYCKACDKYVLKTGHDCKPK